MSITKVSYSLITGASINVLDFGADPTGVNDSTAAFTSAKTAALATNKTIYIPAGTYKGSIAVGSGETNLIIVG